MILASVLVLAAAAYVVGCLYLDERAAEALDVEGGVPLF